MREKNFKQVVEDCFEILRTYLTANETQRDEAWANFFDCELFERFSRKAEWEIKDFFKRYHREETAANLKAETNEYVLFVFSTLRKKYQGKPAPAIAAGDLSRDLYLSLRRVDEYLRKELEIPHPPKPLVRLYHLRQYKSKTINSNSRTKAARDANISSFMKKLRAPDNPAAKFIVNRFDAEIRQKILTIDWENSTGKIKNEILSRVCRELNRLIKEYDGERNQKKRICHQQPFMFFAEFSELVGEDEKIKYRVSLTNRYKNREILSRVFPEINPLESVRFAEISENAETDQSQFDESKAESIEKLFNLFIKLPRVTQLVKDFWARVEYCVSEFCRDAPEIYLFKFLVEEGKWTDKSMNDESIKKCILVFCDHKEARFRRYKLNLRKAWKRLCEGKGRELYEQIVATN